MDQIAKSLVNGPFPGSSQRDKIVVILCGGGFLSCCKAFLLQVSAKLLVCTAIKVVKTAGGQCYLGDVEEGMGIRTMSSSQSLLFFPDFTAMVIVGLFFLIFKVLNKLILTIFASVLLV